MESEESQNTNVVLLFDYVAAFLSLVVWFVASVFFVVLICSGCLLLFIV